MIWLDRSSAVSLADIATDGSLVFVGGMTIVVSSPTHSLTIASGSNRFNP